MSEKTLDPEKKEEKRWYSIGGLTMGFTMIVFLLPAMFVFKAISEANFLWWMELTLDIGITVDFALIAQLTIHRVEKHIRHWVAKDE